MRHVAWAVVMAGLVTALGDTTGTTTFPAVFELDLLFPRNETYAPSALMPIVWTLQNPVMATELGANLYWDAWEGNNKTGPGSVVGAYSELYLLEPATNQPYLLDRFINTIAYPEGVWTISWTLQIKSCLSDAMNNSTFAQQSGVTVFNVSQSGQPANITTRTSSANCGSAEAAAFNVLSTGDICGFLRPSPTPKPCVGPAAVNFSVGSSILSSVTSWACETTQPPNVTCPTATSTSGVGAGPRLGGVRSTMFLALLSTLSSLI